MRKAEFMLEGSSCLLFRKAVNTVEVSLKFEHVIERF